MKSLFKDVEEKCRKANFMEAIIEKAHYAPEDRELLWSVLEKILACMAEEAAVSDRDVQAAEVKNTEGKTDVQAAEVKSAEGKTDVQAAEVKSAEGKANATCELVREVVMTLGKGVDDLQEQFLADGLLTEAYMVEVLGSEILLLAYVAYNAWVKERTESAVRRYHFLGTGESFSVKTVTGQGDFEGQSIQIPLGIETIPRMLERSGLPVTCTEGYCMVPKKSVAFYAELTKDKTVVCEGICMGCSRTDCPNRMSVGDHQQGNRALDRPLTYGYARILGLFS